jgi:hypothetical protein
MSSETRRRKHDDSSYEVVMNIATNQHPLEWTGKVERRRFKLGFE